ncbi:hypothetical protein OSTOST_06703, partial [Ostertagia ostertagi]
KLVQKLDLSDDHQKSHVFSSFSVLPSLGNVAIAVNDLTDGNLRFVIRYFIANVSALVDLSSKSMDSGLFKQVGAEKKLKFAVIKRRWSDADNDQLDEAVRAEFRRAHEENQRSSQKIARHPVESAWKYRTKDGSKLSDFWANSTDPRGCGPCVGGLPVPACTTYTTFSLMTDTVRLHVERVSQSEIELTARVCVDELEEEQAAAPAKLLWPFLAVALKNMLNHLDEHQFLQYTIELIPYGNSFFEPPHLARVFDLALFMGTACEYGKVAFRNNDQLHNVDLKKLLPGDFTRVMSILLFYSEVRIGFCSESRLPVGSAWKTDRMEQLRRWQTIPALTYTTFSLDDDIKPIMDSFFNEMVRLAIDDSHERSVPNKPPVLHWTPVPLDMEVQVLLRLSFPLAAPDQPQSCSSSYEWTDGVLLTAEPVRLHVERVSQSEIELTARVCVDELEEEQAAAPAKLLWPFLAVALKNMLNHLDEHQFLQYTIRMITTPYGNSLSSHHTSLSSVLTKSFVQNGTDAIRKVAFPNITLEPPRPKRAQHPNSIDESTASKKNGDIKSNVTGLAVSHNRGRRVSFGSIKLINENNESVKGVDQYVDDMLKQTMDHLVL